MQWGQIRRVETRQGDARFVIRTRLYSLFCSLVVSCRDFLTGAVSTSAASSFNRPLQDKTSCVWSRSAVAWCCIVSQLLTWSTNQLSACLTTPTRPRRSPTVHTTSCHQTSMTSQRSLVTGSAEYHLRGSWPALPSSDWSTESRCRKPLSRLEFSIISRVMKIYANFAKNISIRWHANFILFQNKIWKLTAHAFLSLTITKLWTLKSPFLDHHVHALYMETVHVLLLHGDWNDLNRGLEIVVYIDIVTICLIY